MWLLRSGPLGLWAWGLWPVSICVHMRCGEPARPRRAKRACSISLHAMGIVAQLKHAKTADRLPPPIYQAA